MNWFVRQGLFYKPNSPMGWLLLCIAICFAIYEFLIINSKLHSLSDVILNWGGHLVIIVAVYYTIGFLTTTKY